MTWRDDAPPLRHYQLDALEWISKRGSYGLFDEMRLGKTVTVLRDWHSVRLTSPQARLLVVAPNNVILEAWEPQVRFWTGYDVEVATGTAKQRTAAILAGAPVTVIAYDNLARELDSLNMQRYYYGVFDEAHSIKGHSTQRTKAAMNLRLVKRALVTATPMLNRVDEMWPLLYLAAPTVFPSYWNFCTRYAVYGGFEGRQIVGIQNEAELRAKMAPFCLRRLRREVMADLPDPSPVPIYVPMLPKQRAMYDMAVQELKIEIDNKTVDEFSNPLTKFLRLRQIIGTPACVGGPDESAVLDKAVEQIQGTAPGRKIVVFSQFLGVIAALRRRLEALDIGVHVIQGEGMTATSRAAVIAAWNVDTSPVLIASYGVGREGIDLSAADLGICLDLMWVPALQRQAESRMVNIERKQIPEIIHIHAKNSVSSRVVRILRDKQIGSDSVLDSTALEKRLAGISLREFLLNDDEAA